MAKKIIILVATSTLVLGKPKGAEDVLSLPTGEELTKDIVDSLGLKKADIDDLVARGHLTLMDVRAAESGRGNDPAIVAAEQRAADAEAVLAEANKRADDAEALVAALRADLAAEKKRADDAEADYDDLEKHVSVLEDQIKTLGGAAAKRGDDAAVDPAAEKAAKAKA